MQKMPRFFSVDADNQVIRPAGGQLQKVSSIRHLAHIDGKLILQGSEDGLEEVRDGVGWTVAVSKNSGEFVLTDSGEAVAFVVFGACLQQP